jgi:DNA invertase Pin-like site-specific DNA recombinase
MTTNNKIIANIYCRISTPNKQKNMSIKENSLQSQEDVCRNYCANNSYSVNNIIHEIGSGRSIKNLPKLWNLVNSCEANSILVICDITRFLRNIKEALILLDTLMSKNITVISATNNLSFGPNSTAQDRFQFRHFLNYAELESDIISQRVKRSINFRKNKGSYLGGKPSFGFKCEYINDVRCVVPCEEELEIYYMIQDMMTSKYKLDDIVDNLNAEEHTFRGKPWTISRVKLVSKMKLDKYNYKKAKTRSYSTKDQEKLMDKQNEQFDLLF